MHEERTSRTKRHGRVQPRGGGKVGAYDSRFIIITKRNDRHTGASRHREQPHTNRNILNRYDYCLRTCVWAKK